MTPEEVKAYIWAKCREEGECMVWTGSVSTNGKLPTMYVKGLKGTRHVRPILYQALHGRLPEGKDITCLCGNKLCVAEKHLVAMDHKAALQKAAKRGSFGRPAQIRKGVRTKLARSWITDEIVQIVRNAKSGSEAARLTGVSVSHAKAIRRGVARKDYSSPFVGLLSANDARRRA